MKLELSIQRSVIIVIRVKDIAIIAIFAAFLFIQEQVLSFLPNVQLTVLLIVVYSRVFGFKKTAIIITIHVLLDNLIMGSFNILVVGFMFSGWMFIPLTLSTIFSNVKSALGLAFLGILFAFVYSWFLIIPGMILQELTFLQYLSGDIFFEVILAISSFITILWLYEPLYHLLLNLDANES